MPARTLIKRGLQRFWRLSRGMTAGVFAVVVDAENRVLLVRDGPHSQWRLPGGAVEDGEPFDAAVTRYLSNVANVSPRSRPQLFGIYANAGLLPGDQVAVYVVRSWQALAGAPMANSRADRQFSPVHALPADINPAAALRIQEIAEGRASAWMW